MGQRYEHVCLVSLESVGVYSTYSAVGLLVTHTHTHTHTSLPYAAPTLEYKQLENTRWQMMFPAASFNWTPTACPHSWLEYPHIDNSLTGLIHFFHSTKVQNTRWLVWTIFYYSEETHDD